MIRARDLDRGYLAEFDGPFRWERLSRAIRRELDRRGDTRPMLAAFFRSTGRTWKVIACYLGVSTSRAMQLGEKGLRRFRANLKHDPRH